MHPVIGPLARAPQRVVLVRALPGLGDMLCAVPAFRALRAALPQAHITLIGLPQARAFVERFQHYLDDWLEFPGFPGMEYEPEIARLPHFLHRVHAHQFDLALQMHGNGSTSNAFTLLLGARVTAGCFLPGQYCPHTTYFRPYPEHEHEIWRLLRLVESLGLPLQGDNLEFPLYESDWRDFAPLADRYRLAPGSYVCLHPGASTPGRRWAVEHFATVADALVARGLRVVLTGTEEERPLTQAVSSAMAGQSLDLAGLTSLGSLAVLLHQSALLICNDTGVSHLGAALQIPSVVIFCASEPARWAPLDQVRHRAIISPEIWGHYSASYRFSTPFPTGVTPEVVLAQVDALLEKEDARAVA